MTAISRPASPLAPVRVPKDQNPALVYQGAEKRELRRAK